jgi:hypothetical protein
MMGTYDTSGGHPCHDPAADIPAETFADKLLERVAEALGVDLVNVAETRYDNAIKVVAVVDELLDALTEALPCVEGLAQRHDGPLRTFGRIADKIQAAIEKCREDRGTLIEKPAGTCRYRDCMRRQHKRHTMCPRHLSAGRIKQKGER